MSESQPLRKFRPDDLEQVHRLVVATIDISYPQFYSPRALEFFKAYHCEKNILRDAGKGCTLVAEEGGRILATGTLFGTNIRRVFVDPGCQRRGFGRRIMRELEADAAARNLKFVDLDSSLFARNFYLSQHYIVLKDSALELVPGDSLGYTKMAKCLGAPAPLEWNLDRRKFTGAVDEEGDDIRESGSEFTFIQQGVLFYGESGGGGVMFGEFIGALDGSHIEFAYNREFHGGRTDHALGGGTISRSANGTLVLDGVMEGKNAERRRITLRES